MKHLTHKLYLSILLIAFLITGCTPAPSTITEPPETAPVITEAPTEATQPPTEAPTEPETEAPTEPPTEPPTEAPTEPPADETLAIHSELYIPDVPVEDVILYFNEVCLDAEFTHSGDPSRIQKWISPITYCLQGSPTPEDLETLNNFTAWLNSMDGFPGIYQSQELAEANLRIHFCSRDEMADLMGSGFYSMDGAVTFWYMDDVIYDAIICYRTDLDQYLRNSVILEEIYNGLGPVQDTALRSDSIIYSEFSEPQELTPMDELILRLLYHPDIQCGMDKAACEAVIRNLYY